jgi:hypothetical protein
MVRQQHVEAPVAEDERVEGAGRKVRRDAEEELVRKRQESGHNAERLNGEHRARRRCCGIGVESVALARVIRANRAENSEDPGEHKDTAINQIGLRCAQSKSTETERTTDQTRCPATPHVTTLSLFRLRHNHPRHLKTSCAKGWRSQNVLIQMIRREKQK